jgi:hypothetical protein
MNGSGSVKATVDVSAIIFSDLDFVKITIPWIFADAGEEWCQIQGSPLHMKCNRPSSLTCSKERFGFGRDLVQSVRKFVTFWVMEACGLATGQSWTAIQVVLSRLVYTQVVLLIE